MRVTKKLKIFFILLTALLIAVAIILAVVLTVSDRVKPPPPVVYPDAGRLNCNPGHDALTPELCRERGCIFATAKTKDTPVCFFPNGSNDVFGFSVDPDGIKRISTGSRYFLSSLGSKLYGGNLEKVVSDVHYLDEDMVRIKIYDANKERYEVPIKLNMASTRASRTKYNVIVAEKPFSIKIVRKSSNTTIFDTSAGKFLFADQFLQFTTRLASENLYGIGQNLHKSLRHNFDSYKTWPLFARDQPTNFEEQANLYGVHPFYLVVENDGFSHGVFILNSNAMEFETIPDKYLTYRSIGGILDIFVFMGPHPEMVIQQYHNLIGKPYMPPMWALGFQLSRYGYTNTNHMRQAVDRTLKAGLPLDVLHSDIDHMDERRDFTIDQKNFSDLPAYLSELKLKNIRSIIILDPFLIIEDNYEPYTLGKSMDVFIKWPSKNAMPEDDYKVTNSTIMIGYVWPAGKVAFPDFLKNETAAYWSKLIVKHQNNLRFDGLWIDMNEPANFGTNDEKPWNWPPNLPPWSLKCPMSNFEMPPFRPRAMHMYDSPNKKLQLSEKTLCMIAKQGDQGKLFDHYNVHNLYGHSEILPTLNALRDSVGENKRGMVLTRSTYPSSGKFAGHWLGDNVAEWVGLPESIIGMLESNMFGIPYVGADICGFFYNSSAEMCARWMQLGSFYTFSRNHNGLGYIDQDPGVWPAEYVDAMRPSLKMRYRLLPYLYNLFFKAHVYGGTVVRPLFFEYPFSKIAPNIDRQFFWGSSILISPILTSNAKKLQGYLPPGRWYRMTFSEHAVHGSSNIWSDSAFNYTTLGDANSEESSFDYDVTLASPPEIHLRGGSVLFTKTPANNTFEQSQSGFGILVALDSNDDIDGKAFGEIFWDDGETVDTYENDNYYHATIECRKMNCELTVFKDKYEMSNTFVESITILGLSKPPQELTIYQFGIKTVEPFQVKNNVMIVNLTRNYALNKDIKFTWSYERGVQEANEYVDCAPENVTIAEEDCRRRGCIFKARTPDMSKKIPQCIFDNDKRNNAYRVRMNETRSDAESAINTYILERIDNMTMYGNDVERVQLSVEELHSNILRLKFTDKEIRRYEVPFQLNLERRNNTLLSASVSNDNGDRAKIQVERQGSTIPLFSTEYGGFVYSDQFIQISSVIHADHVYGLGEHVHFGLNHEFNFDTWPMMSFDQPPGAPYHNLYGVQPFVMIRSKGGAYYGLLFYNSNAQEVQFIPGKGLIYRTIGGILDIYFFPGPSAIEVTQQLTALIGRPFMPPYWSLGFQLCRWGYNSLDTLKATVQRTLDANIPLDVQYADIDHMENSQDFTINQNSFKNLPSYVKELREKHVRFIIILDPALITNVSNYEPHILAKKDDIYIKWPKGQNPDDANSTDMLGYVWPAGKVGFPDFLLNRTHEVWKKLIQKHHDTTLLFDGLWIDMNEPSNFGTNEERPWNWPPEIKPYWSLKCPMSSQLETPPYKTKHIGKWLSDKTLCMVGEQLDGKVKQYDTHSLYGHSQTMPTQRALESATGERGLVITRSTFPGSGKYAGHWLGDNDSKWSHMRDSIIGMIEFNIFGIPYVGADICGFWNNATTELCQRWFQLGAFYPFSRSHNAIGSKEQDPAIFGGAVTSSIRDVLLIRYSLLPYYYTLFYRAHTFGEPVIRALFHEFGKDSHVLNIDEQFLIGSHIMITAVLEKNQWSLNAYFPKKDGVAFWFDYYTSKRLRAGDVHSLQTPLDKISIHLANGAIIVTQKPIAAGRTSDINTFTTRQNTFELLITAYQVDAFGELFWDDGTKLDSTALGLYNMYELKFIHKNKKLTITRSKNGYGSNMPNVDKIIILGIEEAFNSVESSCAINKLTSVTHDSYREELIVDNLNLSWNEKGSCELRFVRI